MGHQFSKAERDVSSSSTFTSHQNQHNQKFALQKAVSDNDGLSRATEITDESMTPPPSPNVNKFRHSESWRRGAVVPESTTKPTSRPSYPRNGHSCSSFAAAAPYHHPDHPVLQRRDSDPGHPSGLLFPQQQRTAPVKCPPRKKKSAFGDAGVTGDLTAGGAGSHEEGMEASFLERMYDSRTWEMYRRITEARKQSQNRFAPRAGTSTNTGSVPAMDPRQGPGPGGIVPHASRAADDTSEWENLQQEEETSGEDSQHEMVFLFDF